jgi:hypothetical protein
VSYGTGNSQVGGIDSRSASREVNKNNNYGMHMVNEYGQGVASHHFSMPKKEDKMLTTSQQFI